jgi:hypothetical protein
MYSEHLSEEELRERLSGRELSDKQVMMVMDFCADNELNSTDDIDEWLSWSRDELECNLLTPMEKAQLILIADLVERFWLTAGLLFRLDAGIKQPVLERQRNAPGTDQTKSTWKGYKNPPTHYPDWDTYVQPYLRKHSGRYLIGYLQCQNNKCPSQGRSISEHEAFYLFAKQSFLKRFKGGLYICPFCGGKDLQPWGELDYRISR